MDASSQCEVTWYFPLAVLVAVSCCTGAEIWHCATSSPGSGWLSHSITDYIAGLRHCPREPESSWSTPQPSLACERDSLLLSEVGLALHPVWLSVPPRADSGGIHWHRPWSPTSGGRAMSILLTVEWNQIPEAPQVVARPCLYYLPMGCNQINPEAPQVVAKPCLYKDLVTKSRNTLGSSKLSRHLPIGIIPIFYCTPRGGRLRNENWIFYQNATSVLCFLTFYTMAARATNQKSINRPVLLKVLLDQTIFLTIMPYLVIIPRKLRRTFVFDCSAILGTRRACNISKDAAYSPLHFLLKANLSQNSVCCPKSFFLRFVLAISSPKSSSKMFTDFQRW